MKKLENLGKSLTKEEQKKIMGGPVGEACNCNNNDDCASNPTKKTCYNGAAFGCTPDPKIGWCGV
jgi:hypothetical protein